LVPAAFADGQSLVFVENVEFNLTVAAFAVPRVLTSLSHIAYSPLVILPFNLLQRFKLLRLSIKGKSRETYVKVKVKHLLLYSICLCRHVL
jgi:hypothetical protein